MVLFTLGAWTLARTARTNPRNNSGKNYLLSFLLLLLSKKSVIRPSPGCPSTFIFLYLSFEHQIQLTAGSHAGCFICSRPRGLTFQTSSRGDGVTQRASVCVSPGQSRNALVNWREKSKPVKTIISFILIYYISELWLIIRERENE